jgi:hypothetical protein
MHQYGHGFGSFVAVLISIAALYFAYAFVSAKILHRPVWPFKKGGGSGPGSGAGGGSGVSGINTNQQK